VRGRARQGEATQGINKMTDTQFNLLTTALAALTALTAIAAVAVAVWCEMDDRRFWRQWREQKW
jgi:hypothetical protein